MLLKTKTVKSLLLRKILRGELVDKLR